MKTYISTQAKPWIVVTKNGKIIHKAKVRVGGIITSKDDVEWFSTEEAFNARVIELTPQKPKTK